MRYTKIVTSRSPNGKVDAYTLKGSGWDYEGVGRRFLEKDADGVLYYYSKNEGVVIIIPEDHPWYNLRTLVAYLSPFTTKNELRDKRVLIIKIVHTIGEEYWEGVEPGAKYGRKNK